MSTVLCALTALCGCLTQEDQNKIYTIVLDNGKIQRTLNIPGAYLPEKEKNNSTGVWVQFSYPDLKPVVSSTPTDDSIALYIKLAFDEAKPSMSESTLNDFKENVKNPLTKSFTRHLGEIGMYDVYEEWHSNTRTLTRTLYRKDKNGYLISISEVPGLRTSSQRRYADSLELRYSYSQTLMPVEENIDMAITKLVGIWIQK